MTRERNMNQEDSSIQRKQGSHKGNQSWQEESGNKSKKSSSGQSSTSRSGKQGSQQSHGTSHDGRGRSSYENE